jgi:mono/diheme cytochrome c family protein
MLKKLYHSCLKLEGVRLRSDEKGAARMIRACVFGAAVSLVVSAGVATTAWQDPPASGTPPAAGWILPPDADDKKSPLTIDPKVLAVGKAVFKDKCSRCHGPGGLGDGPDGDPDAPEMNLTNPKRAEQNSDGIVFYKVWNGRRKPKMPAFKEELSEEQAWSVVAFVQTLRKPAK